MQNEFVISSDEPILITGAGGFIGPRVVQILLDYGFSNLRCFVRETSKLAALTSNAAASKKVKIKLFKGNLLSRNDCRRATEDVSVVFHLAAGTEKTFAGCYMNSVVATRNLLDSVLENGKLKRFVNVSTIAVYTNRDTDKRGTLDEKSEIDAEPALRHEAYLYGKVKQDELLLDYAKKFNIPYVIVRPGEVFGPGREKYLAKLELTHLAFFSTWGARNPVPLTYVDNCAEAIVLAGVKRGVDGEVFNIVDDYLPTSRQFLKMYKRNVGQFRSIYMPYIMTYFLCYLWEKYSEWSNGQLPPVFNRKQCVVGWKYCNYSNKKIREYLGWKPRVPIEEALRRYFEYMKGSAAVK